MNFGVVFLCHILGIAIVAVLLIYVLKPRVMQGKLKSFKIDLIILILSSMAILGNLIDSSSVFKGIEKNKVCIECYRNFNNVKFNISSYRFYYNTNLEMGWISPIDGIEEMLLPIDAMFNDEDRDELSIKTYDIKLWREIGKVNLDEDFLSQQVSEIDEYAEKLSESIEKYNFSYDKLITMVAEDNMDNYKILFIIFFPILFSLAIAISIFRIFVFRE